MDSDLASALLLAAGLAYLLGRWLAAEAARARRAAERAKIEDRRPFPIAAVRVLSSTENEKRPEPELRPRSRSSTSPKVREHGGG